MITPSDIRFGHDGLAPVIVRDSSRGTVLMLGWTNAEALDRTNETGEVWFWSRSREELWHKGATSGNFLRVVSTSTDCDTDAILIDAEPAGPTCHTGSASCFADQREDLQLDGLYRLLQGRRADLPEGSYSAYLFREGRDKILKKVGEEATEVVIAAKGTEKERLVSEISDLLFHLTVLMVDAGVSIAEVNRELESRR